MSNTFSTKKLLFVSYHSLIDPSSGAAISAFDLLDALPERNWKIRAMTGPLLDFDRNVDIKRILFERGVTPETQSLKAGDAEFDLVGYDTGTITGAAFLPKDKSSEPIGVTANAFARICFDLLDQWRPDVLLTYGGQSLMTPILRFARKLAVKTVFMLQNTAYFSREPFRHIDTVIVPSNFSVNLYRKRLDLISRAIPPFMRTDGVVSGSPMESRKYVTFINPEPNKGVFMFTQIAKTLYEIRPDIPLLVVEGRGGVNHLGKTGIDLVGVKNVSKMSNTPYPEDFYNASRIVMVPSFCEETFGRVAAEAMMNGIPVIASSRGSLPEICGDAAIVLDIPAKYTPQSVVPVEEADARPWVDSIIKLWDDAAYYRTMSSHARTHARQWTNDAVLDKYDSLLREF